MMRIMKKEEVNDEYSDRETRKEEVLFSPWQAYIITKMKLT